MTTDALLAAVLEDLATAIELEVDQRGPRTSDELHAWLTEHTGHHIPRAAVCEDHDAPFDFVSAAFFNLISDAVVLANRAGGKTDDLAALHFANGHWKPMHETTHFGAIMAQADRLRRAYDDTLRRANIEVTSRGMAGGGRESIWPNGARIEILPATDAQTQGAHPAMTTFDEVEQAKYQPWENAKAFPEEYTAPDGTRTVGQFLATSTRVTASGLMQKALDDAEAAGTPIFRWCILETMQPCDGQDGRPDCIGWDCPIAKWCIGDGEANPPHECVTRPAAGGTATVHGRAVHADGWRSYEQIIAVYNRAGADTWEAQHLSRKPEAKALIYSAFGPANITDEADYGPGTFALAYDYGFTDQTWIGFCRIHDGVLYVFDELAGNQTTEQQWVQEILRRIVEIPGYEGPTIDEWERMRAGRMPWPDPWPEVWPEIAAGAPESVQMRNEMRDSLGVSARSARRVTHRVESGQQVLRSAIVSGGGVRLKVHPRCGVLIKAMQNFRAKMRDDGTFEERPDPSPENHAWSHPCDGLRYLAWSERRRLGLRAEERDTEPEE